MPTPSPAGWPTPPGSAEIIGDDACPHCPAGGGPGRRVHSAWAAVLGAGPRARGRREAPQCAARGPHARRGGRWGRQGSGPPRPRAPLDSHHGRVPWRRSPAAG